MNIGFVHQPRTLPVEALLSVYLASCVPGRCHHAFFFCTAGVGFGSAFFGAAAGADFGLHRSAKRRASACVVPCGNHLWQDDDINKASVAAIFNVQGIGLQRAGHRTECLRSARDRTAPGTLLIVGT